jgi:hypothetical protein
VKLSLRREPDAPGDGVLKIGPERTPRAILEEAKVRAKKIIEEQAEVVRIKANAHAA